LAGGFAAGDGESGERGTVLMFLGQANFGGVNFWATLISAHFSPAENRVKQFLSCRAL